MSKVLIYIFSLLLLFSCETQKKKSSPEQFFQNKKIKSQIKYAELFDIYQTDGIRKVVIHSPFNDTITTAVYYLVDSTKYDQYEASGNILPFPLTNIAVLSSTQLDGINRLGLLNKVTGIADAKYISCEKIKRFLSSGKIKEISVAGQLFTEKTLMLNPQVIFFSPFKQSQVLPVNGSIKAIPFFDFMENTPLGRAEWIKFTAAFTGGENRADTIFSVIENKYLELKKAVADISPKPTVLSGKYFNGQWFVPGGKSYIAQLFADAGSNYFMKNDSSRNSIALDFEVVLQKAQNAEYWRIVGGLSENKPYESLLSENELYKHFKSFKERHIIYCNPAATAYFEKSTLEPQVVLKDFIFVFHPKLFPDYKPVYYKLLH